MPARRVLFGFGLAASVLLAGCVATPAPTPSPTSSPTASPLPEGVTVALVQQRSDVAERMASLRISNGSRDAFTFTGIRLDDSRFAGPVLLREERRLEPGTTTELRFALPGVECGGGEVRRTVTVTGTGSPAIVADVSQADDFTIGLHARECLRAEVERTAVLAWTEFVPSAPDEPARAVLTLSPTGAGDRVVLGGIRSTNLLRFAPRDGEFWHLDVTLPAGDDAGGADSAADPVVRTLEVPLVPQRCDPHVVQEDKRGTIFTLEVVEPREGTIELAMPVELKARVLTWVAEWCGFGR